MLDLIFSFLTSILHVNLRDPHDIPFALPLVFCAVLGYILSFIVLKFIGNENRQDSEQQD